MMLDFCKSFGTKLQIGFLSKVNNRLLCMRVEILDDALRESKQKHQCFVGS